MQDKIAQDLKAAMLSKDVLRTSVLRSIKSAFTYAAVAPGADGTGTINDAGVMAILAKEAKKRQESAEAYDKAGSSDRAAQERQEQAIIEAYLPPKLSDEAVAGIVVETVAELGATSPQQMGQVMAAVKLKTGPSADGALIAKLVKERLSQ